MTVIYKVRSLEKLHPSDPPHVGRFYPHLERWHPRLMQDRQDLVLYLANLHSIAVKLGQPFGFRQFPIRLMALKEWVYDYRVVFDRFFEVTQLGYSVDGKHELSLVIPKQLEVSYAPLTQLAYLPPAVPFSGAVASKVAVQRHRKEEVLTKLAATGLLELHAPVNWLCHQEGEVEFYFKPAGKLQLRDTSIWPIAAIETWPAWLREELFGPGIDIESAYTQFLLERVHEVYEGDPHLPQLLFPDLYRSLENKQAWRQEICREVLDLDCTEGNLALVKKVCMSLANGSRISPAILLRGVSSTRDAILKKVTDTSDLNLTRIGERLSNIARQYSTARKVILKHHSTKANQKQVFLSYFEWERKARYKIWEEIGRRGIMVHDGIDGVPPEHLRDIPGLIRKLNLRLA